MKRYIFTLMLVIFLLSQISFVQATDVIFIPNPGDPRLLSVNPDESFIIIVDPYGFGINVNKPYRVRWTVVGAGVGGIGTFPIVNDKAICYFSKNDENATCGPSPINSTDTYTMLFHLITPSGSANITKQFNIANIPTINNINLNLINNTVYMTLYASKNEIDDLKYAVYKDINKEPGAIVRSLTQFTYTICGTTPCFISNFTFPGDGNYYISIIGEKGGETSGIVRRVFVPKQIYLKINTSKNFYLPGEVFEISGETNCENVKGYISYPNGTKAKDFNIDVSDNEFSYSFEIPSNWQTGQYTISVTEPLQKSLTFSVTRLIDTDIHYITATVDQLGNFTKAIKIYNLGIEKLNISAEAAGELENDNIKLTNYSLNANDFTYLYLNITNIQDDIEGSIKIYTFNYSIEIPVNIIVRGATQCPECPRCEAQTISIKPQVWVQECIIGQEIEKTFTIENNGASNLTDFEYSIEKISGNNLKNIIDIDFPTSVGSGKKGDVKITIKPDMTGVYQSIIKIQSRDNYGTIFVDLNCFPDILEDINSLKSDIENISSELKAEIESHITSAEDAYEAGRYAEANTELEKAKALLEFKPSPPQNNVEGTDLTIPIVAVVAVIFLILAIFIKFRGAKRPSGEEEAEWEREIGGENY